MNVLTKTIFGMLLAIFMLPALATDGVEVNIDDELFNFSTQDLFVLLDGDVSVTFISQTAALDSDLFLVGNPDSIFNNHVANAGDAFSLGSFNAGTQLAFSIINNVTGSNFFTGLPSINPDDTLHALFTVIDEDTVEIGFEDLFAGGDKDYDDLVFQVHNVGFTPAVPEPSTIILLLSGLIIVSVMRKRIQ